MNIANHIIRFLEHPTSIRMKEHFIYRDLLSFDDRNDWGQWQTVYGFAGIGRYDRHYMTYGGGPEGGVVRLSSGWCVWRRDWFRDAESVRIPKALRVIYLHNDDGHEAIKLVTRDYDLN